jgi:hypothetical protein
VKIWVLWAAVALTGCATGGAANVLQFQTPSGRPEAMFVGKDATQTSGIIASACMDRTMSVVGSTPGQVTCEAKMNMGQSVLTQLAIGNSYSTPPRQFVQFSLAQIGSDTRVQASSWVETQMAFGQMQRMATDETAQQKNSLQGFLFYAGAVPVRGTIETPRPRIGVFFYAPEEAFGSMQKGGLYIIKIEQGGPAETAGLEVCDRIVTANGNAASAEVVAEALLSSNGAAVQFTVDRQGETKTYSILPSVTSATFDQPSSEETPLALAKRLCAQ